MRIHTRIGKLVAALALASGIVACSQTPVAPAGGPAVSVGEQQQQQAAPTSAPAAGPVLGTLELHGVDIGYEPKNLNVDRAGRYEVKFTNDGGILHDAVFPGGVRLLAEAGQTVSAVVDVPENGVEYLCSFPGHAEAGMRGTIAVAGHAAEADAGGDHGGPAPVTSIQADPNAPAPVMYDPVAPTLLEGTVHDIDLVMTEKLMTIAPGYVQKVWTFGDTVPGPVIRVKVGDTIRIHLKNAMENQLPHSIDFHSSLVAWNDEMTSINPGEEKIYEWKAEYAGVWMYHCGTPPALHHIANGMYGMVIVEPTAGLPPVDKEYALVQSEWYLGPQGQPTDLTKAAMAAPQPDFILFNGVANQYAETPIEIGTGERIRVFVLNAGPSVDSSFHIVGTIFDTVIKEGSVLAKGNEGNWGAQAVDLAPAQGAIVEFVMAEDGLYPIVTHAFNFVGRGALGLFKAGDGDPKN
jgi:nitrite reductase (NO-forming)